MTDYPKRSWSGSRVPCFSILPQIKRLIGNRMWPIERHWCEYPWMTLGSPFDVWNFSMSQNSWNIAQICKHSVSRCPSALAELLVSYCESHSFPECCSISLNELINFVKFKYNIQIPVFGILSSVDSKKRSCSFRHIKLQTNTWATEACLRCKNES